MTNGTIRGIAEAMRPRDVAKAARRQAYRRKQCDTHGCPFHGKPETPARVDRFVTAEIQRYLRAKAAATG